MNYFAGKTAGVSVTNVATIAGGGINLISKLVTAAIMWVGATLVIDNKMTVGELVAFNMLSRADFLADLAAGATLERFPAGWYFDESPWGYFKYSP